MNNKANREVWQSCAVLGLVPENLTRETIIQAWKDQMVSAPSVHPDLGGEKEAAIILCTAKDVLLEWIGGDDPDSPAPITNNPSPSPLGDAISKPIPNNDQAS